MPSIRTTFIPPAALALLMLGCGGGSDLVVAGKGINVTVDPATVVLPPGGTQSFSARVGGSTDHGVTWTVAGGTSNGSFTGSTGVYTAPSIPGEYIIVAASNADPGRAGTATALVANPVSVTVDPRTALLKPGESRAFNATVTGSPNKAVTWSVVGTDAGSFTGSTGLYTAPSGYGIFTILARSQADPTRFDTATVNVGDTIRVSVSPNPASLLPGGTATFTATVTGTSTTAVDWSIDAPSNGSSISFAGVFTASTSPGMYTVRATSQADRSVSGTAQAVVSNISIAIDPRSATLDQGQTQVFTPTVTGTTNLAVDWSVLERPGTTTRQTGPFLFTAPKAAGIYHLQAASAANPQAMDMATVAVNPVVVSLQPSGGVAVAPGGVVAFTAKVTGSVTPGVTWAVLSGGAGGAINGAGVYTAPTTAGTDTIQATAVADSSAIATALVTVGSVTISPASPGSLHPGQTLTFSAAVVGVQDPGVIWTVRVGGADLQPNPITQTGLFTAPATLGSYRVRATSVVNPALFGEVTVTVN